MKKIKKDDLLDALTILFVVMVIVATYFLFKDWFDPIVEFLPVWSYFVIAFTLLLVITGMIRKK